MNAPTLARCLRLAEALPNDGKEYPIVRELVNSLEVLVAIASKKDQP